jgi:soluble lytic murein transglycosylase
MLFRSLPMLALAATVGSSAPIAAQNAEQGALLAHALDAAAVGDWVDAKARAGAVGSPIADDIVLWTRLREGAGNWEEYGDFLARHPDWPGLAALRRAGERQMPSGQPPETVLAFFDGRLPESGTGSLRLAEALSTSGREAEAEAEIVRAWTTFSMTAAERRAMLGRWNDALARHHEARLDMLLWRGLAGEAEAMKPLVSPEWQKLADARILTRRDAEGLQYAIDQVPPSLRDDPGLAYERYVYRVKKGRWQDAEDFLLARSSSAAALGRPDMWMERRANLARQALADGQVEEAYAIAAKSFGTSGADYADAEWVAGFIALTRLDDPGKAIAHFRRFHDLVATPISLGRAGYWLGRACEAAGDTACAEAAYAEGARYQTSFYGQLAAERAGLPADPALAGSIVLPDWPSEPRIGSSVVEAAYFLHVAGDDARASLFFRQAAAGQPARVRAAVAQMAIDLGRPEIGVRIGKDAATDGIIIADQYYPLHPVAKRDWHVPTEYAMAIARQESELDATAASGVGARGLMQLMPATARGMADAVGIAFSADRLTEPLYNARLGTEYLARMLDRYRGAYILATAAYNAGPGRVDQWLATLGDPRDGTVDPVIWIESIPYSETRNYVMRVLESLHVYRARLQGRPEALRLLADIGAGSVVQVSTRDIGPTAAEAAGLGK